MHNSNESKSIKYTSECLDNFLKNKNIPNTLESALTPVLALIIHKILIKAHLLYKDTIKGNELHSVLVAALEESLQEIKEINSNLQN